MFEPSGPAALPRRYAPFLEALQQMTVIPLADYICLGVDPPQGGELRGIVEPHPGLQKKPPACGIISTSPCRLNPWPAAWPADIAPPRYLAQAERVSYASLISKEKEAAMDKDRLELLRARLAGSALSAFPAEALAEVTTMEGAQLRALKASAAALAFLPAC